MEWPALDRFWSVLALAAPGSGERLRLHLDRKLSSADACWNFRCVSEHWVGCLHLYKNGNRSVLLGLRCVGHRLPLLKT